MRHHPTVKFFIPFLIPILFYPLWSPAAAVDFKSSSSVDEVRQQIEKLPKDNIWWTVNGRDMAAGVVCPEQYEYHESCYYRYSMTVGDGYWTGYFRDDGSEIELLPTLRKVLEGVF